MSSSPIAPTSTTDSSTSSPSRPDAIALVACGALAQPAARIATDRGWAIDVHPLNPLLHNSPGRISGEVEAMVGRLTAAYRRVVVGYADCGTYGALDAVCERLGVGRLPGLHCYDLYAGAEEMVELWAAEPGTYVLTDFLVRSFHRTVLQELGLDRWPELRDDYFGHYTQLVWLVQSDDLAEVAELRGLAQAAADRLGLPLRVRHTGLSGLERALGELVSAAG